MTADNQQWLATLRQRIDKIDSDIQELITARAEIANDVAKSKSQSESGGFYYRPEREAQVLRAVK